MDKREAIELIKRYIEVIKGHFKIKLVVFYGSYTKNAQHQDSDIDVAVFIEKEPDKKYYDSVVQLFKLRHNITLDIEPNLFYYDKDGYEPASFENYIIQNGIVLYKE
jgi:predicted nucleotidyltransferase